MNCLYCLCYSLVSVHLRTFFMSNDSTIFERLIDQKLVRNMTILYMESNQYVQACLIMSTLPTLLIVGMAIHTGSIVNKRIPIFTSKKIFSPL